MDDKLICLAQLRRTSERANDLIGQVAGAAADALEELDEKKLDKRDFLTGEEVLAILNGGTV